MKFYSTNNKSTFVSLKDAILKALPEDNGLFIPEYIPVFNKNFISNLSNFTFQEIAFFIADALTGKSIPQKDLESIIQSSINFPAPLIRFDDFTYILELFHGPTLAFKDFGARFMARLMSYYIQYENRDLTILVATSGDTGGAVASAFYDVPGIKVILVYPSGKVSHLQEQQLTTFGKNIIAVELNGNFDDCQNLVKQSFLDKDLNKSFHLTSANSINIARLIPQCFYYFEAYKHIKNSSPVVFSVPCGNLGNLTAGLLSKKMGLPIHKFLAANNINNSFKLFLETGVFQPNVSIPTLSNAMDVGNPSNFTRIFNLYGSTWNKIKQDVIGYSFNDDETRKCIYHIYKHSNYLLDPHSAIAFNSFKDFSSLNKNISGIILETAHPSKFSDTVGPIIRTKVPLPQQLLKISKKKKISTKLPNNFNSFKSFLFNELN